MNKVALIGEVQGKGGAERVMLEMADIFDADVFSIPYQESFDEFQKFSIFEKELLVERLPQPRVLKIFFEDLEKKFRNLGLDLSVYDFLIIAKPSGVFAAINNQPSIYYCHGPPNYIYQHKRFYSEKYGPVFRIWASFATALYKSASQFPNKWLVNSKTTRDVVKEFYGRDSTVVYPPVNVNEFEEGSSEDYFLSVQNLSIYKNVDWQIRAFEQLDEKLKIVGTGPEEENLRKMAGPNVDLLGSVSDQELVDLYSHSKAVIQTNMHEDFGIVPVEAMASGKPVICPRRGGFRETVIDGETGVLLDRPIPRNLRERVKEFDPSKFDSEICRERSKKFSREEFRKRVKEVMNDWLES